MTWAPYQSIDRETIWVALYDLFRAQLNAPFWQPSTTVTAGTVCVDPQGYLQQAQNDGTTGTSAPAWNDSGITADGEGATAVNWKTKVPGFVSVGRKHKAPPRLTRAEQPALFVIGMKEDRVPQKYPGVPNRLILHGFLILYLMAPQANEDVGTEQELAATELNLRLRAIDDLLLPDRLTGKFTLGGLVEHCWIEGTVSLDPAVLGPQAAALVPIHILVP